MAGPAWADGQSGGDVSRAAAAPSVVGAHVVGRATDGPDVAALEKALRGLPDRDATAALVRVGGHGTWRGKAGVRDLVSGRGALTDARFRAGSTTKVVTSAVVLQLAAEGRIDLDGTVQEYLPGLLSDAFGPITVRHLLTFTSGLQPGANLGPTDGEGYERRFETLTPEVVVAASVAKGPHRGPGEGPGKKQRYGDTAHTVRTEESSHWCPPRSRHMNQGLRPGIRPWLSITERPGSTNGAAGALEAQRDSLQTAAKRSARD